MGRFEPARYEIRVEGHLDISHTEWLGNIQFHPEFRHGQPITLLSGLLADQAALHGVLHTLEALGMVLLEVIQVDGHSLEKVRPASLSQNTHTGRKAGKTHAGDAGHRHFSSVPPRADLM